MNIHTATASYESWLGKHLRIIPEDLDLKHKAMAGDVFPFLRATFYRWMQVWPEACNDCAGAPKVLGVGDLHVENFGTWRDIEGRLVWGINDFDEAFEMPYTLDLVRLAVSAHLAIRGAHLQIGPKDACDAILAGYVKGLESGGNPFVLSEHHHWLTKMVTSVLRDPPTFWQKLDSLPSLKKSIPKGARRGIEKLFPQAGLEYRVAHRIAGLGSLGRERYVALAEYCGGKIAREAKALAPSACTWAANIKYTGEVRYQEILDQSVRSPDPFVRLKGRWIVRRLSPYCSRVELSSMPKERDESRLLQYMGFETANIHLGTPKTARAILDDLRHRQEQWLHHAAQNMAKATTRDWEEWRAARPSSKEPAGKDGKAKH